MNKQPEFEGTGQVEEWLPWFNYSCHWFTIKSILTSPKQGNIG